MHNNRERLLACGGVSIQYRVHSAQQYTYIESEMHAQEVKGYEN